MAESAPADRRTTGTAGIGAAIAVGGILLLSLGGLGFWLFRAGHAGVAFAANAPRLGQGWVEDLRSGRLDEAYKAMTPAFRAQLDRAAFGRWVADHPELKSDAYTTGHSTTGGGRIEIGLSGIQITGPPLRSTFWARLLPAGKGPSVLTLVLVGDRNGDAFVDHAEVEPEEPTKP